MEAAGFATLHVEDRVIRGARASIKIGTAAVICAQFVFGGFESQSLGPPCCDDFQRSDRDGGPRNTIFLRAEDGISPGESRLVTSVRRREIRRGIGGTGSCGSRASVVGRSSAFETRLPRVKAR